MTLDEVSTRRLAFIRYLLNTAVEQSQRPEPLCSASILTFHDATELFLQLACEHLGVGRVRPNFLDYWEVLGQKLSGKGPTQKESMRRLNSARVELKHHGTLPSKLAIEGFRANAINFFEENTPILFGIGLSDVSLIELVQFEDAKKNLKEAEYLLNQSKIEDALDKVALAFEQLIRDYEMRKMGEFGRSPFFFGKEMDFLRSFFWDFDQLLAGPSFTGKMEEFVDSVRESLEALQGAVKILSLGIDYRRYAKFRLLTPNISWTIGGGIHFNRVTRGTEGTPTSDDVQFCIDFVIESAITLQEFDFNLEKH